MPLQHALKRTLILVYLASRCGHSVRREQLLAEVFGHGPSAAQATLPKLGETFAAHKKYLRADRRVVVAQASRCAGTEVLPADLDILFETWVVPEVAEHFYQRRTSLSPCTLAQWMNQAVEMDTLDGVSPHNNVSPPTAYSFWWGYAGMCREFERIMTQSSPFSMSRQGRNAHEHEKEQERLSMKIHIQYS